MRFEEHYTKENEKELIESLSDLEHQQWMEWAKSLMKSEKISEERKERWGKLFIPYEELTEESKEQDRVYARKIIKILEKMK